MIQQSLLNCNKHGAKAALLPLRASRFGINFQFKIYVFSGAAPGHHSFTLDLDLM
jgi:hypothetical protein